MNDIRKIAFIGAGNMTQSIVGGMCKSGYQLTMFLSATRA